MYLRKISAADRMGSMLLDHFIMCIIIFALSIPLIIVGAVDLFTVSHESSVMNDLMTKILFAIAIAIYLNKDFLNGRSPAKRVIKSQVISNRTNLVASPLLCLIRNFTIILWPIEVIVVLVSPERRLGDYLAGTRVEHLNHEQLDNKPNYKDLPAVLAIGLIFSLLVSFTMDNWFVKSDHYQYVEESYDPEYSTKISYLLNNRFSSIVDSTDVKYYQKILAITFTNKAAAEMKDRIIYYLRYLSLEEDKDNILYNITKDTSYQNQIVFDAAKNIYSHIIHNYNKLSISTIDKFTTHLVRSFSKDLGLSYNFDLELDNSKIMQPVIALMLSEISAKGDNLSELLVGFVMSKVDEGKSSDIEQDLQQFSKEILKECREDIG